MTTPIYTPPPDDQAIPLATPTPVKTRVPDDSQMTFLSLLNCDILALVEGCQLFLFVSKMPSVNGTTGPSTRLQTNH